MATKKSSMKTPAKAAASTESGAPRAYLRFTSVQRAQHWLLVASFLTLAVTGLVQKFAFNPVSFGLIRLMGGVEVVRSIHHVAAIVMIVVGVYHLLEIGYKFFVRRVRLTMLPGLQDAKDAWAAFAYNIGLGKKRPQMGRYTFEEKAEYWALIWGIVVMALTGFLMWNPITATKILPGEAIPAAKAAHGGEAVLAVLAIIVWHMYGVLIKHRNRSMFNGHLGEEEMLEEHPLELADIKAGVDQTPVDPVKLEKRRRIYVPVAAVLAVVLLAGLYGFVTGERTALTTIPPQENQPEVFVPQTPTLLPPPLPTATPGAETTPEAVVLTWDGSISPLFQKCTACHGASNPTAGLNLTTYADALKGSKDGAVILPGDSANSLLVKIQQAGGHPGQLSPDEIDLIVQWIDAGAPEK